MTITTSVSSVAEWDTCHRKAYYSSPSWGLGYSPTYERDNLALGSLYHNAQAWVAKGKMVGEALAITSDAQHSVWDAYSNQPNDADSIISTYEALVQAQQLWQSRDNSRYSDANLDIFTVEEKVRFTMEDYEFTFVLDRLVRHKPTGVLMPFEFKTSKYPEQLEAGLPWDLQPRFYCYAVSKLFNEPVPGVLYEFARATNPNQVTILKDGLPSQAMATLSGTTYEIYYDTLVECAKTYIGYHLAKPKYTSIKEIMEAYEPTLEKFRTRVDPIFWRRPHWVTLAEQEEAAREMLAAAKEMEAARVLGPNVRATGLNRSACNAWGGCPYKSACLVHSQGGDYEGVLASDFLKNKKRLTDYEETKNANA